MSSPRRADSDVAVLEVEALNVHFQVRGGRLFGPKARLQAVNDVSFSIPRGQTLGLVGESGSGKTTLIRTILGLQPASSGRVLLDGDDLLAMDARSRHAARPKMQVVFQDPSSSLNPRMTVHDIVAEPLRIQRRYSLARVEELLAFVGMTPEIFGRRPGEFSGGQRQRIGIARALALSPELLILDEPVSSLDVSIQAQVINLLGRLQAELDLTYLFIAHDLAVVRYISHQVAVMYRGRIIEIAPTDQVLGAPAHPYTQSLLAAVPVAKPEGRVERWRQRAASPPADLMSSADGCAFRLRCARAQPRCAEAPPPLRAYGDVDRAAACYFPALA